MSNFVPYVFAFALALLSAGCAQQPSSPDALQVARADAPTTPAPAAQQPKAAAARPAAHQPVLPHVALTEQIMFKMLLAEVAAQRDEPQIAVPAYLELARETRDPRIAERATELAWNARMMPAALEAANLWLKADPGSMQARQILAVLLVSESRLDKAEPHLKTWLASDPDNIGTSFLQLAKLLSHNNDRQGVLHLMQTLAQPYPQVPEARLAVAEAAWNAGAVQTALDESSAALALRPDWELAALFHAEALQTRSNSTAADFLGGYLKTHPNARDVRLNYARLLVSEKRYPEARKQFEVLLAADPNNGDVAMAVAVLAMQAKDYDRAQSLLEHVLASKYRDPDVARLYLGQLNEERDRYDEALKWYASIGRGDQYISAKARYAGVLAKQGKLDDARRYLHAVPTANDQERVQLIQAEAQLLRDAKQYQTAYDVLTRALAKMPDSPDLLYDHAMAADKIKRFDVLESDLRELIKLRPDSAHAYNALGYTLADRNERLPEARKLIQTALKLTPDDPFIMDSMGWVLYRMGHAKESIDYLRHAYSLRADAEIAAHLGEVLWSDGQHGEARKIWSEALKQHANNELLNSTVKHYAPLILPAAR